MTKVLVIFKYKDIHSFKIYESKEEFDLEINKFLWKNLPPATQKEKWRAIRAAVRLDINIEPESLKWQNVLKGIGLLDLGVGIVKNDEVFVKKYYTWFPNVYDFLNCFEVITISIENIGFIETVFGKEFGVFPI